VSSGVKRGLPQITADMVIADKGFDADERVIEPLERAGKSIVIPPKANRKHKRHCEIDAVFSNLLQKRVDGLLVSPDPLFTARRAQILILATHHRLPAGYFDRVRARE
jgi:hypothetical protein